MSEYNLNETVAFHFKDLSRDGHCVTFLDNTGKLQQVNLNDYRKNTVTFGRGSSTEQPDIVVSSPIVSRMHGRFVCENGHWYIEDNDSTNGILSSGFYIKKRALSEGALFRIGHKKEDRKDCVLILVSSDASRDSWKRFPLQKDRVTIGRSSTSDLVLPFISVSRVHATLFKKADGWYIKNENSENGVIVNDTFIKDECRLCDQDVITITTTKIIFSCGILYYCFYEHGISVDAQNVVVMRGKGDRAFMTADHISMSIMPGELVAIIGGSGAGKSTIMNTLCGYLEPTEGKVYVNGIDLYQNFESLKKSFGYVPQSDIVYNNLSLYDMLQYTAELRLPHDTSPEERDKAIMHAIAMVELTEKKDSLIRNLSGGQRKRASIAVELLSDPKLLFLDEPASGLDPGTERSLMQSLKKMTKAGKTVILVTHSTLQLSLCDKIAFMGKGGRLCFFGKEEDALHFFGTPDIVDVYAKITDQPVEWNKKYLQTCPEPEEQKPSQGISSKSEKHRIYQLKVLCSRYAKLVLNDRQRLALLILQAPLLAFLISLVADGEQFKQYEMTKSLLFSLSCSGFWIGMLNAIQEICKEKIVLKREYMTGLSLSSYVLSKAIVLGILSLLQCLLLVSVFWLSVGMPEEGVLFHPAVETFITAWLTAVSSAAMGLFVSSLFTNPDRAMTVAPLLLMPQMLFSGLLFKLSNFTEYLSWLAICRWSMEGLGSTADLNGLPQLLEQKGFAVPHEAEDFFIRSSEHMYFCWLMMIGFTVVFLVLARVILSRIRKAEA